MAVVAVMLARSVAALQTVDLGYRASHLMFARLLPASSTAPPGDAAHYARLLEHIESEPGVSRAGYAQGFPNFIRGTVSAADLPSTVPMVAMRDVVSDRFFETIGIAVTNGRAFGTSDTATSRPVAILSASLASGLFPGVPPLGRLVVIGDAKQPPVEVIGVVEDTRLAGPRQAASPVVYRPRSQQFFANPVIVATSNLPSDAVASAVSRAIQATGRDYTGSLVTVEQHLARTLAPERTLRLLALTFGGFVVALAGIGLFAVQTTSVMQQRRHTCIRLALGEAPSGASVRLARNAFALVAIGVALGLPAAAFLANLARGLLFGLSPFDPATLALVTAWFLGVGAVVALVPTRIVFRLNLVDVLKGE
jgi:ABC-type antimicrobial peptide transport system permease subunit